MSTDEILFGTGLILVLAVGCQVAAGRLRVPSLILLLPAGFIAGALTQDVNPQRLLGPAFEPLVSLSVAVILYDAGLGLDVRKLRGRTRRVVRRLITVGVPVTWACGAFFAALLLGLPAGPALMLGAILVVSGPTVVAPLLAFIRPTQRLQRVLSWEGSLIDPVGGILGAVVFRAVVAGGHRGFALQAAHFAGSVGLGLAGGAVGIGLLWLGLRVLALGEVAGTSFQLASVIAVTAACDIGREDSGLIAAVVMGLAVSNMAGFDLPARRPFFETLVQLIIGVLFVAISATVTPASLRHLILPSIGLVAVLVVAARPVVAFLATARAGMTRGERRFTGWMAPRGIMAAATASTFSAQLTAQKVDGATEILPVTFLVIVATVVLYGLTAVPVARWAGVTRSPATRPLLVGDGEWVLDLARVLRSAGLDVLVWAGLEERRERIRQAGLALAPGELLASAAGRGAQMEGVTAVLLLTDEDDFNALAATVLAGGIDGPVYRLGPRLPGHGVVAPYTGGEVLFGPRLTRYDVAHRYEAGARFGAVPAAGPVPGGGDLLFLVHADGRLEPVTAAATPVPRGGDTLVFLRPAPSGA